ncbi:DUF7144 family membrane protein [Kitasatospora camelliae]|uniref:DUF7144 family membrane protein n=1 Tax=Kitasatospora camelliae TaxID=3156397 RepID=UPI003B58713F
MPPGSPTRRSRAGPGRRTRPLDLSPGGRDLLPVHRGPHLPYYPVWSIPMMAIDLLIIWALSRFQAGRPG